MANGLFASSKQLFRIDPQKLLQRHSRLAYHQDPEWAEAMMKCLHAFTCMGLPERNFHPDNLSLPLNNEIHFIIPVTPVMDGKLTAKGMVHQVSPDSRFGNPSPLVWPALDIGKSLRSQRGN